MRRTLVHVGSTMGGALTLPPPQGERPRSNCHGWMRTPGLAQALLSLRRLIASAPARRSMFARKSMLMSMRRSWRVHPGGYSALALSDPLQLSNSGSCHEPSHGGFYMAEGAFYIRIGLPPHVVSGDCLALSCCGLIDCHLHCCRARPMSRD